MESKLTEEEIREIGRTAREDFEAASAEAARVGRILDEESRRRAERETFPACAGCGEPVVMWIGPADSLDARCGKCWDVLHRAGARSRDLFYFYAFVAALGLAVLAAEIWGS